MSEVIGRTDSDYSKFDSMSTEELREYLRADSYRPDCDAEEIIYITELLTARNSCGCVDVNKAWESFSKNYAINGSSGMSLYDLDNEPVENVTAPSEPAAERKAVRRGARPLISAALIACVILAGSATASALGYNILNVVASWTKDTFGFEPANIAGENIVSGTRQIPDELKELESVMLEHGLSSSFIPSYIPDGYHPVDVRYDDTTSSPMIMCQLDNGSNSIIFLYNVHTDSSSPSTLEKDSADPEIYTVGGIDYYIMTNMGNYLVTWIKGDVECSIFGVPTHTDIKKIIDSLDLGA